MAEPIGVTGATGRLGGRVARLLADAGVEQRLLVRDPAKAPDLAGAAVVPAKYADGAACRDALQGVRILLMVSGSETPDRVDQHRSFVDAAAQAGVEHIVYTSFYGAAPDATFTLARDHWATEQHIRASGMAFTFLRDNLYADFFPYMIGDDDVVRGPAENGKVAAVALDDIAESAVAVLKDPQAHAGATYNLTGPQALTFDEIAAILSKATGRPIRFVDESVPEAYESRARYNAPDWQVDAWVSTYTAIAKGEMAGVSGDIAHLTGHPATSLNDLLELSR